MVRRVLTLPVTPNFGPGLPALPAPTLQAVGVSETEIDLTASYPAGVIVPATFTFQVSSGPFFLPLATQTSPAFPHTGLIAGETFFYRANVQTTETPSRTSDWSPIATGTTLVIAPPVVNTLSLPAAQVGTPYSQQLVASGGIGPYTWGSTGSLNGGLTLSASGLLSGTPTGAGETDPLVVTATDSGARASLPVSLPLVINPAPILKPGQVTGLTATATGQTTVALTWTATPTALSYVIFRGGVQIGVSGINAFADSGLSASTTYQYTVAAVNSAGTGPVSAVASATTQAVQALTTVYKWFSGDTAASNNINGNSVASGGNGRNAAEILLLKAGASTATGIDSYAPCYLWSALETAQGVYNFGPVDNDAGAFFAANPGKRFKPCILADINSSKKINTLTGIIPNCVPQYISHAPSGHLTVNGTAYTMALQVGGGYGYGYSVYVNVNNNDPTQSFYIVCAALLSDPAVNACWINFWKALAAHQMLASDGKMYSMDTHPQVDMIVNRNEVSYAFNGGPYPVQGSGANACTNANWWTNYEAWGRAATAAWPHTLITMDVTFGVTGADGSSDSASSFNVVNGHLSQAHLGGIRGLMLLTSDCFGASWTLHYNQNLGAQIAGSVQAFIGCQNTQTSNAAVLEFPPANTAKSLAGKNPIGSSMQSPDFGTRMYSTATTSGNASPPLFSASGIAQMCQAGNGAPPPGAGLDARYTIGASHNLCYMGDLSANPGAAWAGYIHTGLVAARATYPLNATLPSSLQTLAQVTGLNASVITQNTITLNWTAAAGATSYVVYLNGAPVGAPSGTSFQYTGLAVSSAYNLTVAMVVGPNTGPVSAILPITTKPQSLAQVTNVHLVSASATTITVGWSAQVGATSYTVTRNGVVVSNNANGTFFIDSGLTALTAYNYTVAMNKGFDIGPPSATVSLSTNAYGVTNAGTLPNATQGGFFAYQLQVSGGTGPWTWARSSSSGLTTVDVLPNGYLHAAPTATGANTVSGTVTDSLNVVALWSVQITVDSVLRAYPISFDLATQPLPAAMASNKYRFTFLAAGGTGVGLVWSNPSANIPAGLTLTAGVLAGTPTTPGDYPGIVIQAIDSGNVAFQFTYSLHAAVNANGTRPAGNTGTGFYVANGKIYDSSNAPFLMRGFNQDHEDDSAANSMAHAYPNTVRFGLYNGASDATQKAIVNTAHVANKHFTIVQRFGNITTPPAQQGNSSGSQDPNLVTAMVTDWVNAFAVWSPIQDKIAIGIANEWGPDSVVWKNSIITAIGRLRTAGYTCPIVVDAGGFGQDLDNFVNYSSAVFNADPFGSVIFDIHIYKQAFTTNWTPATIAGNLAQLTALQSNGQAFIIGEFGPGGLNGQTLTPSQIIAAADAAGLGWCAWAWDDPAFALCTGGNVGAAYPPVSQLTAYGRNVILNPQYGVTMNASPATSFLP